MIKTALTEWVVSGHIDWRADRYDSRRRRLQWVGPPAVPEVLAGWRDGHALGDDPDRIMTHTEVARFTHAKSGQVLRWWRDGLLVEAVDGHGRPVVSGKLLEPDGRTYRKDRKPQFRAFDVMGLVLSMIAEGEGTLTYAGSNEGDAQ
jgi:hypothetical protein